MIEKIYDFINILFDLILKLFIQNENIITWYNYLNLYKTKTSLKIVLISVTRAKINICRTINLTQ